MTEMMCSLTAHAAMRNIKTKVQAFLIIQKLWIRSFWMSGLKLCFFKVIKKRPHHSSTAICPFAKFHQSGAHEDEHGNMSQMPLTQKHSSVTWGLLSKTNPWWAVAHAQTVGVCLLKNQQPAGEWSVMLKGKAVKNCNHDFVNTSFRVFAFKCSWSSAHGLQSWSLSHTLSVCLVVEGNKPQIQNSKQWMVQWEKWSCRGKLCYDWLCFQDQTQKKKLWISPLKIASSN